jgi:hypothetical protein
MFRDRKSLRSGPGEMSAIGRYYQLLPRRGSPASLRPSPARSSCFETGGKRLRRPALRTNRSSALTRT